MVIGAASVGSSLVVMLEAVPFADLFWSERLPRYLISFPFDPPLPSYL